MEKSTFTISLKLCINKSFTNFPNSVGTNCFCSFSIYLLSKIVVIVGKQDLNKDQYKLYKLIYNRFMASQMKPAIYDTMAVNIKANVYDFKAVFKSIFLGSFIAFCTAVFVISLNVTLFILSLSSSNILARCHAIASPSRSGSVAK